MMSTFWQDIRYAARVMFKTRAITIVALTTLALGIGANTAIFTVINALLLRPLPYPEPERLVIVWQDLRGRGGPATEWTGPSQQFDWKAQKDVFDSLTSVRGWSASMAAGEIPESLSGEQVTYDYFDVTASRPALGRAFTEADDIPNAPRVALLSHGLWTRRFGGDPGVVGRSIRINGESHEIVGVMPAGFTPIYIADASLWRPMRLNRENPSRNSAVFHTFGRLRAGVTIDQARARLAVVARELQRTHPESDTGKSINPVPLQEQRVGSRRASLLMLQGAVAFVLLIACVNIANLLLSRASGRSGEIAVRRALGADRARIVRQLLTESLLLAICGGALGAILGTWGVGALKTLAPSGTPRIDEVVVDARVLLFTAALSLVTGMLFGLMPAAHAARDRVSAALKQSGRGQMGDGGRRVRSGLIVAELALALVLLVGGGLLLRTFLALQRVDLGFNPKQLLTGFVLPPPAVYRSDAQRLAFYDAVLTRAAALPGVTQAALSSVLPLSGDSDTNFLIEGRPEPARSADASVTWYRDVSANYFAAMEIPLKRGRLFADREAEPIAVINETMAKRYWPGEDPIGRRIKVGGVKAPWLTIVGTVADVRVRGAREPNVVETYIPYWHNPEAGINVVLKAAGDPAALAEPLKRVVKSVDPTIAVASVETMEGIVADSIGSSRFYALLVAIFAGLALVLAAVGIYGAMSYAVSQRMQEIGVRLALGAGERQIFRMVVGETLALAAAGLVIGGAGAIALGRAIGGMLFGVPAADAVTFAGTATLLLTVAFLAAWLPARRAMRVDPMAALRAE
ncbi:MAG TPA: ABC transporter permease [Vicinamibacterales bacterium]|nr:ABC transporter permease [Vicinamibacterales bacterium]